MNPLLDTTDLPRFTEIRPEHIAPAVDELLADASDALARATSDAVPPDFDALSAVLDVATERLQRAWGAVSHLNAVADTPALRAAYTENLARVVEFYTRLGADERLFAKYRATLDDPRSAALSAPRRKALANAVRDFRLSGAELRGADKQRFAELMDRQSALRQTFSEHVLDATDGFSALASEAQMAGVPDDVKQAARARAEADGAPGYKLTLHLPCYVPLMQHAADRDLRRMLYRAYATRASEFGPAALDNTPVIGELLESRAEEAALLGHPSFADVSLVPKMADSPSQVMGFLHDLARRARPSAERDVAELRDFARTELGLPDLQMWDLHFVSERLKEQRYAFSEQEVKPYFTEDRVVDGLFEIAETLFDVRILPDAAEVWHPSVRFFRIERPSGALVAQFYLDLHARPGKRPGAWMGGARDRWARPEGGLQTPVAHLVCNFAPPLPAAPGAAPAQALLTHGNVITLFHEFGHGLHHMLTQVADLGVSGTAGVEWDAVELPSQFMENFCWEWDVLARLTAHVDTGEPLPQALFDRMLAAKNFQSGLQTLRQVEFALVDMRLHAEAGAAGRIAAIADDVRREVAVFEAPSFSRPLATFSHIFAGGYAAGYYSYKWAEVLSADAFGAFEEQADGASGGPNGVLDPETGRRYREAVLESGGSRTAMETFKAFRGREPTLDALLRHQGLADATTDVADAVGAAA